MRATRHASLVSSPSGKNISLRRLLDTALLIPAIPRFSRGALRGRHERWVRDAMDARLREDEARRCGRRSRVVLTPRRWRQIGGSISTDDGGKKARSPRRSRRKPLKPSRREGRKRSGEPVVTNSYAFYLCIRGCGRIGRPVFPAPSVPRTAGNQRPPGAYWAGGG